MSRRAAPAACLVALLSGCHTQVDFARSELPTALLGAGGGPVALAVEDHRPRVVAGELAPSWAGGARITLGIPSGVHTHSGEPLAQEVLTAWLRSAARAEVAALPAGAPGAPPRTLLLAIEEWASDGYFGEVTVRYDLALRLRLGGAPPRQVGRTVGARVERYVGDVGYADACRRVLRHAVAELFDLPEVAAALRTPPRARPPEPPLDTAGAGAAACGGCGFALEAAWAHCPSCGAPVGRPPESSEIK